MVENHPMLMMMEIQIYLQIKVYIPMVMNNWGKFNDTELPKKEYFYRKSYDEHISGDGHGIDLNDKIWANIVIHF